MFLHQHSQENTRFRVDQEPSQLDLLFTNDKLLISDIRYEHPIGKSDHIVLVFNFHGGDISDGSQDSVSAKPLWHITGAISIFNCFKTAGLMESGPAALSGFRFDNNFNTPLRSILISGIVEHRGVIFSRLFS